MVFVHWKFLLEEEKEESYGVLAMMEFMLAGRGEGGGIKRCCDDNKRDWRFLSLFVPVWG